jgi:hypothetical protein
VQFGAASVQKAAEIDSQLETFDAVEEVGNRERGKDV